MTRKISILLAEIAVRRLTVSAIRYAVPVLAQERAAISSHHRVHLT